MVSRNARLFLSIAVATSAACTPPAMDVAPAAPPCGPVDSAWALRVHAVDAATRRPVANAIIAVESGLEAFATDTAGWACLRALTESSHTLTLERPGYERETLTVGRETGTVATREIPMRRVAEPCCDLRGRWRLAMELDTAAATHPNPVGRHVSGEVGLGARYLAPQEGDELDSLVHVVRGLHQLDFTPFFGGMVAPDVSRSVFGSGPDLLHEVAARVTSGDSVWVTLIPRMSHGSIALKGTIRGDTIRGTWIQNAYCCGARGRFEMVRIAPPDSEPPRRVAPARTLMRPFEGGPPPTQAPPGTLPGGRWSPAFAVSPAGQLWLARRGLFVADSLTGAWRLALGGPTDAVDADELRSGATLAFVDSQMVLLGLRHRYPNENAPVLYRTTDAGAHWNAITTPKLRGVVSLEALGRSVWLVAEGLSGERARILASDDAGTTWRELSTPPDFVDAQGLYRISAETAYVSSSADAKGRALWRTVDAGKRWTPVMTPHDQGVQHVPPIYVRIVELATIGRWLVVKELEGVFATPIGETRWRRLPGLLHVAGERDGRLLFALDDSLRPTLLDDELRPTWRAALSFDPALDRDIQDVLMRNGRGYVVFSKGTLLEASPGAGLRWLGPKPTPR